MAKFIEYKFRVRTLDMKAKYLKQLPVKQQMPFSDMNKPSLRMLGWFYGDRVLGKEYPRGPMVVVQDGEDVYLWVPSTPGFKSGTSVLVAGPHQVQFVIVE